MRKLIPILALLACLFWAAQAKGQLTYVQSTENGQNGTSLGLAYPTNTTLHSLLVVQFLIFGSGGCALSTVADTHTNTWVQAGATAGTSCSTTGSWLVYYVQSNSSAGADTVTITGNGSVTFVDIAVIEYTNQAASALDVVGTPIFSSVSSTTMSFPTITTTLTNETILALGRINTNPNNGSTSTGYTARWINAIQNTSSELPADGAFGPGSHTTTFTFTSANTSNFSNLFAFKATNSALPGGTRHRSTLADYHPPEKFTPQLLYTILRNWIKETYEGRA